MLGSLGDTLSVTVEKLVGSASASLKAHSAGLGAALTLLITDLNQAGGMTADKWYGVLGAYAGVGAVVHMVPNTPKTIFDTDAAQHDDGTND